MLNKLINYNGHDHTSNCRYFIIGISFGNLLLLLSSFKKAPVHINYVIFTFPLEQDYPLSPACQLLGLER